MTKPQDPAKLEHQSIGRAGVRTASRPGRPVSAAQSRTIRHRPRFVTEDMVALRLAALRGIGVCQFPAFVVEEDLRTGRLIDLLPDWAPKAGIIHAAFPSRRGLLPSVRALLDFLAREYAEFGRPGGKTLE
jgi:DNA-binding transcriptional LysR family regulator